MKFMIGRKLNMTQLFRPDGTIVPVTRISVAQLTVTLVKTAADGSQVAVQVGSGAARNLNKASAGHLKGLTPLRTLREFRTSQAVKRGDQISVETFAAGDIIDVVGTSKGRGFAGVVKRHHFAGAPKTHGHKHDLRAPGSIGAGGVQRVFKGLRMAGHMGSERVTVKNLEVVQVNAVDGEILVKGAVPGARNSVVILQSAQGELVVQQPVAEAHDEVPVEEAVSAEVPAETPAKTQVEPQAA